MSTITKFYLHDATTTDTGTLPGSLELSALTGTVPATGAATNRAMDANPGSSQTSATCSMGATDNDGWFRRYLSAPLAAQTIPLGNWTCALGYATDNQGGAPGAAYGVYIWRPSSGSLVARILDRVNSGTGPTAVNTEEVEGQANSGPSQAVLDGDVLVVEIYDVTGGIQPCNDTFYYDGTVDPTAANGTVIASAASFVSAPSAITMSGPSAFARTATDSLATLAESAVDIKGPGLAAFQE